MGKIISIETTNLITFSEAAKLLSISRPTLYKRIKEGILHPISIGRNQYIVRADIETLRKKPNPEAVMARALEIARSNENSQDSLH